MGNCVRPFAFYFEFLKHSLVYYTCLETERWCREMFMMKFKKDIDAMRFLVLIPECMKEMEWYNIGMLMNMQANALKTQDL